MDVLAVHAARRQRRQFEEGRARVDQVHHAFPRQKLAARDMPFTGPRRPAQRGLGAARLKLSHQFAHTCRIGVEFARALVDR